MNIKKWILVILILFFFVSIQAATFKAGTKSVGGNVYFNSYKYDDNSTTSYGIGLAPALSYFIFDNVCLDVSPSFGVSWAKGFDTITSLGYKLGGRYFINRFYCGARYHYTHTGSKNSDYKRTNKYIEFLAGFLFPLKKNIYLDLGVVYTNGTTDKTFTEYGYENDLSRLSTTFGVSIFF